MQQLKHAERILKQVELYPRDRSLLSFVAIVATVAVINPVWVRSDKLILVDRPGRSVEHSQGKTM
jgi:hypothetical protein